MTAFSIQRWLVFIFFFSSRRRHTRLQGDWSSDVCSSDLLGLERPVHGGRRQAVDQQHGRALAAQDRKSTRLNSSHLVISYAVFCLEKKKKIELSSEARRVHEVACPSRMTPPIISARLCDG